MSPSWLCRGVVAQTHDMVLLAYVAAYVPFATLSFCKGASSQYLILYPNDT